MKPPQPFSHFQVGATLVSYIHGSFSLEGLGRELSTIRDVARGAHWRHVIVIPRSHASQTSDEQAMMQAWMYGIMLRTVRTGRIGLVTTGEENVERLLRYMPAIESSRVVARIFATTANAIAWIQPSVALQFRVTDRFGAARWPTGLGAVSASTRGESLSVGFAPWDQSRWRSRFA